MKGVFVTGTDTGIGKTLVSAVLARAWGADYWKPVQTGLDDEPGDTPTVAELAGLEPGRIHPPAYGFGAPLSPQAAAELEGAAVDLDRLVLPGTARPLVVEGAGGVLVPLNGSSLMIDLIARLGLPAAVVARSTLGTINHTLLTLEALRARRIEIAGVVLNGPPSQANASAIASFGAVSVLMQIPPLERLDGNAVSTLAQGAPPLSALG